MSDYNGWKNYETWRVNLEIFDGFDLSECFNLEQEPYDLGFDLKEHAESLIDDGSTKGLALDYALAFLHAVDFRQIAKHLIDNHQENQRHEEIEEGVEE
jgi:hypothetical protein